MSSLGAAQEAASAYVPVPVISRKLLHTGPIVKVKVPVDAVERSYPNGDNRVPFFRSSAGFRGGFVNFFFHEPDQAFRGTKITARASVFLKELEDGREYLYIDFQPVPDDTPVTHCLAVMSKDDGSWDGDDHLVFKTPSPFAGQVIFGPLGTKIVPKPSPASIEQLRDKFGCANK